jgi:hypothetical protein
VNLSAIDTCLDQQGPRRFSNGNHGISEICRKFGHHSFLRS